MKIIKGLALILTALALTGCASTTLADISKSLANDPATVVASVNSIYGTVKFTRVGVQTNVTTTVSPDGTVTIKSTP